MEQKKIIEEKDPRVHERVTKHQACEKCFRLKSQCICDKVTTNENHIKVVILQHPQEQFKKLNSARLCNLLLKNSKVFVGLSWPSFKKVAGESELPSEWGILYLKGSTGSKDPVEVTGRKKEKIPLASANLRGIIAIDGSWKQAKTLWWRNPWFLKLNRISLNPEHESLRNQTKKEGLSTIESVALALKHLGEKEELTDLMVKKYEELILK